MTKKLGFSAEHRETLAQLAGVDPSVSDQVLGDALLEALDEAREHYGEEEWGRRCAAAVARATGRGEPAPAPASAAPALPVPSDEGAVEWAVATGRIGAARAQYWLDRCKAERAASGSIAGSWATLQSLHPVYDASSGGLRQMEPTLSATARLDAEEAALFGDYTRDELQELHSVQDEHLLAARDRQAAAEAAAEQRERRRSQLLRQHRNYTAQVAAALEDDPEDEELMRQLYPPEPKPKPADRRPRQQTYGITPQGIVWNEED
ncbi:hypothetical protein J2S40_004508 [Nocardioides luteus]|uniref:Uncharacterized protein n=1 Tax=Nocardioides luteus TaxID=1844 RepID=A0ABQ5SR51_9ACTN|nr:hypothetical protein [Nocardioides luteus]MDR7313450.1 hypothetical protein [Nocardioides luteus]GGR60954.1 hypothetical protein GCM10010197_30140 [Nocardioides luteus]GLJ66515.1 hypothetical protein GCM10017579_05510 [Nocardioides luteus]